MIYDHTNALGATGHDMDAGSQIGHVLALNPQAGWILAADEPLRPNAHGHIAARRIRFRAIHPIQGDVWAPCLFHCYGRLP